MSGKSRTLKVCFPLQLAQGAFGMDPAQGVLEKVELSGSLTEDH
jgi:hypothetical protein